QRMPAEQPSPLPAPSALEPRGGGIRLRIHDRQDHEGPGPGAGDEHGRGNAPGRSAEIPELLAGAAARSPRAAPRTSHWRLLNASATWDREDPCARPNMGSSSNSSVGSSPTSIDDWPTWISGSAR